MKSFLLLFTLAFLFSISGCHKAGFCDGVVCQNGGSCVDGNCVCINGYTGTHCEAPYNPTNGTAGNYLVNTYYYTYTPSGDDSSWTTYNDTLHVIILNDSTIQANADQYIYNSLFSDSIRTVFGVGVHYYASIVTFYKNDPDSISTQYSSGGTGGTEISKAGRRIH